MPVELHETEIDGVRCFWVDAGRPTLSAQLAFRQGMADETLNESGWLHLLEHLCLHGRGGGALHVNGAVSVLTTEFSAHGPTGLVAEHLRDVTDWLASPDLRDLGRERDVLRAEARLRGGPGSRAFGWRYGARGPGLACYDDPGLGRATGEALSARAARVFTTGNAVLALDGPPPAGLRLHLPSGPILPASDAVPYDNGMAAYVDEGGLVLSGVVPRSGEATVVPVIVQRALKQRLRDQAGGAYAPWADYHRVDSNRALVLAGSDISPTLHPRLAGIALDLVARFASEPVPQEWLEEIIAERLQAYADPHMVAMVAWRAASMWLVGDEPETHAEMVEKTRRLDPQAIRADLVAFSDSLLLGIPGETLWHDQLPMLKFPMTTSSWGGRSWRHRDWPANNAVLTVDASRVAIARGETSQAVALGSIAGLYCYPDGARQLITLDGWGLGVEPDRWRGGHMAIQILDASVPAELHLPQPARDDRQPFRPAAWPVRWWRFLVSKPMIRYTSFAAVLGGLMLAAAVINFLPVTSGSDVLRNVRDALLIGVVVFVVAAVVGYRPRD